MEFVLIPAGKFMMGSPSGEEVIYDEAPIHKVTIEDSFYMGKYPVTQKQWKKIQGSNPSSLKGEDWPVEMISWEDAQEFIQKLNEKEVTEKYRLSSEAEWEYSCRAGTQTRYSFGEDESKLNKYAWYEKILVLKFIQLARRNLTLGVSMICMGMSGNGFKIGGMKTMKVLLLMAVSGKMEIAPIV